MSTAPRPNATWADLARLPEGTRAEILDGQILFAPSPGPQHQGIGSRVLGFLGLPFDFDDNPGGWWILHDVDVELAPTTVLQPDVAGWRRTRVPDFPSERPIRILPDWVCEIVSPSSVRLDRLRKTAIYLEAGVPFFWIIDPEARLLEAFQALDGRWLRLGAWSEGDRARIPPFDAVELDVGRLFPPQPRGAAPPDSRD
jgi:Uma2 family endonuclease